MEHARISLLTVCGLTELDGHGSGRVSHVLSILDPGWPDPDAFGRYDGRHRRTVLRFHDIVEDTPGQEAPRPEHVEEILAFGLALGNDAAEREDGHLLIHCHMGISRSTAAMATLLAQAYPEEDGTGIMRRLTAIRPQAWPNLRMIGFADDILRRGGDLTRAASAVHRQRIAGEPHLADIFRGLGRAREVEAALALAA